MADIFHHIYNITPLFVFLAAGVLGLVLCVAYLTFAERKIIGWMQGRLGPNRTGPFGLLQPIADGIKLLHKESIFPTEANTFLMFMAPVITFTLSVAAWAVIPVSEGWVLADINVGILYIMAISALGVYGLILAGWSSRSKYALLGALRSAAQMISYEVAIGFIIISVVMCSGSMNLSHIVIAQKNIWFMVPLFPLFIIFIIAMLAETNRAPFDLPEAEAELVAGYNVEYSSFSYALFFLGEYANMILMSSMATILFCGGWLAPFSFLSWIPGIIWFGLKVSFFLFIFIWVRASLPRYRYDQLMDLGWKVFLPITLGFMVFIAFVKVWWHAPV